MDFYTIRERMTKNGVEIYPEFLVRRSNDIVIKGKGFVGIWDEAAGLWSTDEFDVARLIDEDMDKIVNSRGNYGGNATVKYMRNFSSNSWKDYKKFLQMVETTNLSELDSKIAFLNSDIKKSDYISKRLSYSLEDGNCPAYEKIMSTLYSDEERAKLEWAIGSVITGDSKKIQKFIVLYGDPGTGKSTVLEIIQKLFEGYYIVFEAKDLTSSSNIFATEAFRSNPLIAIQHDGDLSKIEDNTKINSIISHEEVVIHEKYKSSYSMRMNSFLFMGTNKPVKITDGKAGLIRRLIDVHPTGNKIPSNEYYDLMDQIQFELGSIAKHCLDVYLSMGKDYYAKYRPVDMMYKTDPFFNFVEDHYDDFTIGEFKSGITLKEAYSLYKQYCDETNADYKLQMYKFREELKNYFDKYEDEVRVGDTHLRNWYSGFTTKKFKRNEQGEHVIRPTAINNSWIIFTRQSSKFDEMCGECLAQLANDSGTPSKRWQNVTTKLKDIYTGNLHYVKVPENHIVIDFDIKDSDGNKSFKKNLEAASKWPETYAELSKSGGGIHLHYIYNGDVSKLSRIYDEDIEIKVFNGNSSLRRKLTKCTANDIATISSGLPLKKGGSKVVNENVVKTEKALRSMIKKNLNKEIHASTKPSMDFIFKLVEDYYNSGAVYDISDLRPSIMAFAANSTHQADYCLTLVNKMHFKSDNDEEHAEFEDDKPIAFFDSEVFKNYLIVCYKFAGEKHSVIPLVNPSPSEIENLFTNYRLIGFNNRRYDNHILYSRFLGYNNEQMYNLSHRIINSAKGDTNCFFREAYNISYTDIYDYSTKKQSLKKWEIELGIHHQEAGIDWDAPLPEEKLEEIIGYCCNDVIATEAVWNNTQADFTARKILVEICKHKGINATVNDTTNGLTVKIIFGNDKHPKLIYTDLATGEQS